MNLSSSPGRASESFLLFGYSFVPERIRKAKDHVPKPYIILETWMYSRHIADVVSHGEEIKIIAAVTTCHLLGGPRNPNQEFEDCSSNS
jgi:hypothetical protein